ncbi:PIP-LIKE 5 [Hibiscus trionum]|uniref:PIP-LIKE 5 n=1 Tax=Hibiscus trionum TaxID=183268 RepID=A0A9W7JIN8_HIBTR|nr:PIP-LIKE 5 [Hibiscus trionum]
MKSVPFVLVLLVLLVSTEFAAVNGRPLRSSKTKKDNVGIKQGGADDKAVAARVPTLPVSANNSKSGVSFRSLVYKLASGPSKKGPGH